VKIIEIYMIICSSIMNEIFSSLFPSNDQILTDFMYFYNKIEMNLSIYFL